MKTIWVIGRDKKEMIEAQRAINSDGSMRAVCILSNEVLHKAMSHTDEMGVLKDTPSLIILDYDREKDMSEEVLLQIKQHQALAGIPLFFMMENRTEEMDELCYSKGATVVLHKPFSKAEILRIERTAWQHDVTKSYEKMLQKQAGDLLVAKEVQRLNDQLRSRNDLLHQIFGRYFSEQVVDMILEQPQGAAIGGEKREITIMMADLRGFTSMSETLDSDVVTDVLNHFFSVMAEVITEHNGTVIEYLGDAILAVFGAPLVTTEQTEKAIAAAIQMQNQMQRVNEYCESFHYPVLEMGIGIHRGEVFIGNVGSENMMRYNVIGQAVNLCSRIESYSLGGQILISQESIGKVDCQVKVRNLIEISVKGIQKPVPICEVLAISGRYACAVEYTASDILHLIKERIVFNLYLLDGKMITEQMVTANLTYFSRKTAKVLLEDTDGFDIKEYSDVEIFAAKRSGKAVFTNVYAKVMKREDKEVTLSFTHVNKGFQTFAEQCLKNW